MIQRVHHQPPRLLAYALLILLQHNNKGRSHKAPPVRVPRVVYHRLVVVAADGRLLGVLLVRAVPLLLRVRELALDYVPNDSIGLGEVVCAAAGEEAEGVPCRGARVVAEGGLAVEVVQVGGAGVVEGVHEGHGLVEELLGVRG